MLALARNATARNALPFQRTPRVPVVVPPPWKPDA
jgi:hypothetical protein